MSAANDDNYTQKWTGFRIVGDNVDKNFRRSFQRVDYTTRSFHYFHSYAVLDRVDFSGLSDIPGKGVIDTTILVPSDDDNMFDNDNIGFKVCQIIDNHDCVLLGFWLKTWMNFVKNMHGIISCGM